MTILNKTLMLVMGLTLTACGPGLKSKPSGSSNGGDGGNTSTYKKIYLAARTVPTGDSGVSYFDDACDAGYKALIGDATRHPDIAGSGSTGWVLAANQEYRRQDGVTVIGTTNSSAVFDFPLTNSFGSAAGKYFTGLQTNWTVNTAFNCSDWGSMADDRTYGDALSTNANAIAEAFHDCGTSGPSQYVVCVEQ